MATVKKTTVKKQVVKQDMIDFIKAQGMTKALKRAGQIKAKGVKGEAEFVEGVKRMYGATRLNASVAKYTPTKPLDSRFAGAKAKPKDSRFSGMTAPKKATKPTDSRFTGLKAKPKDSRFSGLK